MAASAALADALDGGAPRRGTTVLLRLGRGVASRSAVGHALDARYGAGAAAELGGRPLPPLALNDGGRLVQQRRPNGGAAAPASAAQGGASSTSVAPATTAAAAARLAAPKFPPSVPNAAAMMRQHWEQQRRQARLRQSGRQQSAARVPLRPSAAAAVPQPAATAAAAEGGGDDDGASECWEDPRCWAVGDPARRPAWERLLRQGHAVAVEAAADAAAAAARTQGDGGEQTRLASAERRADASIALGWRALEPLGARRRRQQHRVAARDAGDGAAAAGTHRVPRAMAVMAVGTGDASADSVAAAAAAAPGLKSTRAFLRRWRIRREEARATAAVEAAAARRLCATAGGGGGEGLEDSGDELLSESSGDGVDGAKSSGSGNEVPGDDQQGAE